MKKTIFLLPLLIFFTACSMNAIPDSADSPLGDTPPDFVLADLTLTSGGELSSQGIPFDESGNAVVTSLAVSVYDDSDTLVTFDDDFRIDASGSNDVIEFALGESKTVALAIGESYTFKAKALDTDAVWMAYDEQSQTIASENNTVAFNLKTLIDGVSISTTTPINYVSSNQTIDFFTTVTSPGGYAVPMQDFSMSSSLAETDGEVTKQNKRGLRVTAAETPSDATFDLTVTAAGWTIVDGEAVDSQSVTASISKTFLNSAGFSFDVIQPSLSVNSSQTFYAAYTNTLSGSSSDDIAIAKLQIYQGLDLIGSSLSDEHDAEDVVQVSFSGSDWSMPWRPEATGSYELTVIAIDTSGNQNEETVTLTAVVDDIAPTASFNSSYYFYNQPMSGIASDAQSGVAKVEIYAQAEGSGPFELYSSTLGGGVASLTYNSETGVWSSPIDYTKINNLFGGYPWRATMKLVVTDNAGNTKEATATWDDI